MKHGPEKGMVIEILRPKECGARLTVNLGVRRTMAAVFVHFYVDGRKRDVQ